VIQKKRIVLKKTIHSFLQKKKGSVVLEGRV